MRYKSPFPPYIYLVEIFWCYVHPLCVSRGHGIIDVQPMPSLLLLSHLLVYFGTKTNDWKFTSTLEHFCLWIEQVLTCSLYYPPLIRYETRKWTSAFLPWIVIKYLSCNIDQSMFRLMLESDGALLLDVGVHIWCNDLLYVNWRATQEPFPLLYCIYKYSSIGYNPYWSSLVSSSANSGDRENQYEEDRWLPCVCNAYFSTCAFGAAGIAW
jgi:hypothetical protein